MDGSTIAQAGRQLDLDGWADLPEEGVYWQEKRGRVGKGEIEARKEHAETAWEREGSGVGGKRPRGGKRGRWGAT